MIISLTGTPGTGKTTIAKILNSRYDIKTVNIHSFAQENDLINEHDESRRSDIIDIDLLNKKIIHRFKDEQRIVLDGHLSHFLTIATWVIVLRCHPDHLKARLEKKGWNKKKIKENIDAEILDIIESEAVDIHPFDHVLEIDTTEKHAEETAESIYTLIQHGFTETNQFAAGTIDWTDILMTDEYQDWG